MNVCGGDDNISKLHGCYSYDLYIHMMDFGLDKKIYMERDVYLKKKFYVKCSHLKLDMRYVLISIKDVNSFVCLCFF